MERYFKKVGAKGKENNKNISPQPRVDPKKTQLKKKSEILDETPLQPSVAQKKAQTKKQTTKDDILDINEEVQVSAHKRNGSAFKENSRNSTPAKSLKKKDTDMDIEYDSNSKVLKTNRNSLLQAKKNATPVQAVQISSDELEVIEPQSEQKGQKKIKLKKMSEIQEKKKANVKPTKKQKAIMLIESEDSNKSESDDEEDSVQGNVDYVDDEVDNLQKNKRVDKMIQNQIQFKQSANEQPKVDPSTLLKGFLLVENQTKQIQQNLEQITLDDDEGSGYDSAEEELRRIEMLEKGNSEKKSIMKAQQEEEKQKQIMINDTPKKQIECIDLQSSDDRMEEEFNEEQENQIINIDESSEDAGKEDNSLIIESKKFFFAGKFNTDEKQLKSIIHKFGGSVISLPGDYNIFGVLEKAVLDKFQKKNINYMFEDEFIKKLEANKGMRLSQIIENNNKMIAEQSSYEAKQKEQVQQKEQIQNKEETQKKQEAPKNEQIQKPQKQQQQQQQQQPQKSHLLSFLHTSAQFEEHNEVDDDLQIVESITSSEVVNKKTPFFKKADLLKQAQSQPITIADDSPDRQYKKSSSVMVEEKSTPARITYKSNNPPKPSKMAEPDDTNYEQYALWTHKYAPQALSDCVGNQAAIKKLEGWLINWENVIIHKQKAQGNWRENPGARACLVSGPPGIGKTSTVRLLAQRYNMNIIEWNASDVRNKSAIESIINPLKDNTVLNFNSTGNSPQRSIILMDEVDGMSSGDIGGNQALIKIIKETKNPIFCICNDRYSQKLRSLTNSCYDVRFYKPNKDQVSKRLMEVCQKEGLKSTDQNLQFLSESVNNDIRQALNLLQMQSKKSKNIDFKLLVQGLSSFKKDEQVSMNPFEASKVLMTKVDFERKKLSERLDLFFLDYELIPLLIHENYLGTIASAQPHVTSVSELENLAIATAAMAESDVLVDSIRSGGNWCLLQQQGFLTSVYVPEKVCTKQVVPQMSQYLGKFSSQRKTKRLIRELRMKLSQTISGNRQAVQFDYAQPIMEFILHELETNGKEGVEAVVDLMAAYNITPELLKDHLISIQYKSNIEERLKDIPTSLKTQLTKSYNKRFKDDVKPDKKTNKKENDEGHVKYDDVLGEIEDIEIDEEEDVKVLEEDTNDNSEQLKSSQATSTKSQPQKNIKAQTVKNVKEVQKEPQKQKNTISSLFQKKKK